MCIISTIMITNIPKKVKKNYQRSSFVSPALGWAGQGRLKNIMPVRQKNFRAKPKQTGKKKRGSECHPHQ